MLIKRRPIKRTLNLKRKVPGRINYSQIRKEVILLSNIGLIIKDTDFFKSRVGHIE